MHIKQHSLLALSLACALGLSACSSTTEAPASNLWKSPDVGSVYVFDGSSTRTTISDSTVTQTEGGSFSFIAQKSGQSIGGKTNVTTFSVESGDGLDIAYEANGDFSVGDSTHNGWEWTTYPTGLRTMIADRVVDSLDPYGTLHRSGRVRRYGGQETITLAGRSYASSKVFETSYLLDSNNSHCYRTIDSVAIWWVPELKMFGKWNEDYQDWQSMSGSSPYYYRRTTDTRMVMYGQRTKQSGGVSSN